MTMSLRVIVADDERPARQFLVTMLRSFEDVDIVGEAQSGNETMRLIEQTQPDLAFLDLQMPEMDGLSIVRSLRHGRIPLVAFVTAFDEHAVSAFEIEALDYLLKPVDRGRLRATIDRARERLERASSAEQELPSTPLRAGVQGSPRPLIVKCRRLRGSISIGFPFASRTIFICCLFTVLLPWSRRGS